MLRMGWACPFQLPNLAMEENKELVIETSTTVMLIFFGQDLFTFK
jgi:hypothetical protein